MTVSVSRETRAFVQARAKQSGMDQSAVVEDAVRRMQHEERRKVAQESLLADAEEDLRLVEIWESASPPLEDEGW